MEYRNTVDLSVSNITCEYRFVYSLLSMASSSCGMWWWQINSGKVYCTFCCSSCISFNPSSQITIASYLYFIWKRSSRTTLGKRFYRSLGNLWEITVKTAICNTFTKINFVTVVLQAVHLDFKQRTIVLKFLEHLFSELPFFSDCFCPYEMKRLPSLLFFIFIL